MDWFHLLVALCICLVCSPLYTNSHLLPDDLLTDDAEQLERERRSGGFFDRILKVFPWFNKKTDENEEENEDEDITKTAGENNKIEDPIVQDVLNDDDITASFPGFDIANLGMPFKDLIPSSVRSNSLMEPTSDTVKPTDTISTSQPQTSISSASVAKLSQSTSSLPLLSSMIRPSSSQIHTVTATPSTSSGSSELSPFKTLPIMKSSLIEPLTTILSSSSAHLEDSTISPTQTISTTHISVPTATAVESSSSLNITPTPTFDSFLYLSTMTPSLDEEQENKDKTKSSPFVEIIMASGPPHVPDEKGYAGDVYAQAPQLDEQEDHGAKGMRVIMSSMFVPVMSGLFGALCVALVISIMKCVRRRRLKKVKYYGGKPESRLYGLDHMGLLSDMSSDEEN